MLFRLNSSAGVPIYFQFMEQIKYAIETGALKAGDQLPTIRKVAKDLKVNQNTVVRAYRELQHEGVVELRHGFGTFISESVADQARVTRESQAVVQSALHRLIEMGLSADEMKRLFDNELAHRRGATASKAKRR